MVSNKVYPCLSFGCGQPADLPVADRILYRKNAGKAIDFPKKENSSFGCNSRRFLL
jgi:hypothetical protein